MTFTFHIFITLQRCLNSLRARLFTHLLARYCLTCTQLCCTVLPLRFSQARRGLDRAPWSTYYSFVAVFMRRGGAASRQSFYTFTPCIHPDMSARLCSMCIGSQWKHSLKERGQMSDVNQLESLAMTFTWSVIESCWWANITATSARKQLWDKLCLKGLII